MKLFVVPLLVWASAAIAATINDWRSRSIYQVMIDRYGRSDASITASCDPGVGKYCGGSWEGLINNLDYIQNMGFTAVSFQLLLPRNVELSWCRFGFHQLQRICHNIRPIWQHITDIGNRICMP